MKQTLLLATMFGAIAGFISLAAAESRGANIAWVSLHLPGDLPSAGASGTPPGSLYTEAPDKAYTDLLTAAGHSVTRVTTPSPALPDFNNLNTFDLVIVGRSINSGDFELDNETLGWNVTVTKPMIIMSGYAIRSNRLGFTTGTTIPDTGGATNPTGVVKLKAENPGHVASQAIFQGIALDGTNTMVDDYTTGIPTAPYAPNPVQRGISVNTNPITGTANGAVVLATINTAGDAADDAGGTGNGGMIIGYYPKNSVLPNTGGTANSDTLGGDRLIFLSGTREDSSPADKAGLMDLTETGKQLFRNAVTFLSGPPVQAGDVDLDGDVDMTDFNAIKNNFQKTVANRSFGDLTGDTLVDWRDFRQWKTNFPFTPPPATAASGAVPEPASAVLGLMASGILLGVGRSFRRRCA